MKISPKTAWCVALLGAAAVLLVLIGKPYMSLAAGLMLFGCWSLLCVIFGQHLEYKRFVQVSPLPDFDPLAVFRKAHPDSPIGKEDDIESPPIGGVGL